MGRPASRSTGKTRRRDEALVLVRSSRTAFVSDEDAAGPDGVWLGRPLGKTGCATRSRAARLLRALGVGLGVAGLLALAALAVAGRVDPRWAAAALLATGLALLAGLVRPARGGKAELFEAGLVVHRQAGPQVVLWGELGGYVPRRGRVELLLRRAADAGAPVVRTSGAGERALLLDVLDAAGVRRRG